MSGISQEALGTYSERIIFMNETEIIEVPRRKFLVAPLLLLLGAAARRPMNTGTGGA